MLVRVIMTRDVQLLASHHTIRVAARLMRDDDNGSLPVAVGDRLVGIMALDDLATKVAENGAEDALVGVSKPTR